MQHKRAKGQIETAPPIRFYSAPSFTIIAQTPRGAFNLFKVVFSKADGSVMVPFPYHGERRGILSETDASVEPDPKKLNLVRPGSVVVDYDVKCSFHLSGWVVFSRTLPTGQEQALLPRREGFPLDGAMGQLFQLHVWDLAGMEPVNLGVPTRDYGVRLRFPDHPKNIRIRGTWYRKADVASNTAPGQLVGPDNVKYVHRASGHTETGVLLGQPLGFRLRDHLLLVTAEQIPDADGADTPTVVFMGGWDAHEGHPPASLRWLSFLYPYMKDDPLAIAPGAAPPPATPRPPVSGT